MPSRLSFVFFFQVAFSLRREDKLGAQNSDERYLLIPSLLPMQSRSEISREWVIPLERVLQQRYNGEVYGRRYLFEFLPVGYFSRLMVRILHLSGFRYVFIRICPV